MAASSRRNTVLEWTNQNCFLIFWFCTLGTGLCEFGHGYKIGYGLNIQTTLSGFIWSRHCLNDCTVQYSYVVLAVSFCPSSPLLDAQWLGVDGRRRIDRPLTTGIDVTEGSNLQPEGGWCDAHKLACISSKETHWQSSSYQ